MELFSVTAIKQHIEPGYLSYLKRLDIFPFIDSTNTYLLQKARLGAPSGSICLAETQSQGRGRLDRQWHSPPGNIYCSLLWRFNDASQVSANLSLAIGAMILIALKKYGLPDGLQLKWPNDILFADRKLAGILIEHAQGWVIGFGINVTSSPQNTPSIDLTEIMGYTIARNKLVGLLINEIIQGLLIYEKEGLKPFLEIWQQYDALYKQQIVLQINETITPGMMHGINHAGKLLFEDSQGNINPIDQGEIIHCKKLSR